MGPIEGARENVRKEPYSLPKGYQWDTVNVSKKICVYKDGSETGRAAHFSAVIFGNFSQNRFPIKKRNSFLHAIEKEI